MEHSKAIVTIAIGEKYLQVWKKVCEANWREYADTHGYDLICIDHPLDNSDRAKERSPAWQKCLILSQEYARRYERIVWVDADILINTVSAPSVVESVPIEKVGAVGEYSYPMYREFLERVYQLWGSKAIINYTPQEYYRNRGFIQGFNDVVQTGVMVLSPQHHRQVLEETYFKYEDKGGREWHMEQCPLSFELLKADMVHWIDYRFNFLWAEQEMIYYPFLFCANNNLSTICRIKRKLLRIMRASSMRHVKSACITSAFLQSYFLHFGGSQLSIMKLADLTVDSWLHCIL